MSPRPLLAALALIAPLAAACLEAGPGAHQGATDTVSPSDLLIPADTTLVDPCAHTLCDDGDPCTADRCDPVTGECHFDPLDTTGAAYEPPECAQHSECDDGDPCTEDQCVFTEGGCGYRSWAFCGHFPVVGCGGGCQVAGCDDGDPCTRDSCGADGACAHEALEGCASGCNGVGAVPAAEVNWTPWPGDALKVAGVAAGYPAQGPCYEVWGGGAPEGAEAPPRCMACEYPLGLGPAPGVAATIRMTPPLWVSAAWFCLDGCVERCSPMVRGAAYWAWGTATSTLYGSGGGVPPGDGSDAAPVRPSVDGLAVVDYCLQTNAAGLVGRYTGTVELGGFGTSIPFEAEIHPTASGALAISLTPAECVATGCPAWIHEVIGTQTVILDAGDGTVSFTVELPGMCDAATTPTRAVLASQRNTLAGPISDAHGGGCVSGTMALTREP